MSTERVTEYARQVVEYVRRALGIELAYDSDTLPLLDHYLRSVPDDQPSAIELVATTAGSYFGEVVRRRLGGRWDTTSADATEWRVVLPTGLNFAPSGFVAAAIVRAELEDLDTTIDAPPRMRPYLEQAMGRMGEVSFDDFYSLCGRLDTLEHVHEVLVGVAAQMLGKRGPEDAEGDELTEDEVVAVTGADEVVPPDPELDEAEPALDATPDLEAAARADEVAEDEAEGDTEDDDDDTEDEDEDDEADDGAGPALN